MITAETITAAVRTVLRERKLLIVKPERPTLGAVALEAYGFGKACDAVALQGDDLDAVLNEMGARTVAMLGGAL